MEFHFFDIFKTTTLSGFKICVDIFFGQNLGLTHMNGIMSIFCNFFKIFKNVFLPSKLPQL